MNRFGFMQNGHVRDMETGAEWPIDDFIDWLGDKIVLCNVECEHLGYMLMSAPDNCEQCQSVHKKITTCANA